MQAKTINELMNCLPQTGKVEWIGVRYKRRDPLTILEQVNVTEKGLEGDHYSGKSGKRAVTLIQQEHIDAVSSMLHLKSLDAGTLRRNIVVSGINLLALKNKTFQIGSVILEMTGLCHPCSRMEEVLGAGGYNAMRGHGGINARIIQPGTIKLGDSVKLLD